MDTGAAVDPAKLAPIMGLLWAPVTVVTSYLNGAVNAQIAVAIGAASIVPEAPRLLVQIYKDNYSHDLIYKSQTLALNFLRRDQVGLIPQFGLVSGRDRDKLAGVAYDVKSSGSPVLRDCWGYLDCRVVNAMDGGDMTCFLAQVLEGDIPSAGDPLWWRDARRELSTEHMEQWDRKINASIQVSLGRMERIEHTPWQPERGV